MHDFKQSFPERTYVQGVVSGKIALGGTFEATVSGSASISNLDSVAPPVPGLAENLPAPSINPKFDLQFSLANTAHVNASTADLYLNGSGRVGGSLAEPQANANLIVQKGQLRLPSSTVRIEDGGTVTFTYHKTRSDTLSRLDVDLTGLTQVVAPGTADTIQRYDITLGVKGDLLSPTAFNSRLERSS